MRHPSQGSRRGVLPHRRPDQHCPVVQVRQIEATGPPQSESRRLPQPAARHCVQTVSEACGQFAVVENHSAHEAIADGHGQLSETPESRTV